MEPLMILAEAIETAPPAEAEIIPIDWFWSHITSLNLLEAITFISFGVVCLFYGWRVFKMLVIISFALLGAGAGLLVSDNILSGSYKIISSIVGMVIVAAVSIKLMRWSVSILGAIAGGMLTAALWYACMLPEKYMWAGGLVGAVAGGMISFIVFKIAIMLFSCLGGSGLVVVGSLALLHLYPGTSEDIKNLVYQHRWFLPAALTAPTIIGILLQNEFIKGSKSWSV